MMSDEECREILRSATRTPEIERIILEEAQKYFRQYRIYENRIEAVWDHNHWWVQFDDEAEDKIRTFDVVDVEDELGNESFGFEEC